MHTVALDAGGVRPAGVTVPVRGMGHHLISIQALLAAKNSVFLVLDYSSPHDLPETPF
jgi:hypothetical protein